MLVIRRGSNDWWVMGSEVPMTFPFFCFESSLLIVKKYESVKKGIGGRE